MIGKISIGIALGTCVAISQLAFAPAASAKSLKVKRRFHQEWRNDPDEIRLLPSGGTGMPAPGTNISPPISWSKGPRGTKSYAVILNDTELAEDEPRQNEQRRDDGSQHDPRQTFYHWVLVDIPANVRSLKEGADSNARVLHGKPATPSAVGVHGLNMFTMVVRRQRRDERANTMAMTGLARPGTTRTSIIIISSSTR